MQEKLKQFIEKKGVKKWFQRDNLIIIILSGVLLLIIALPTTDSGTDRTGDDESGFLWEGNDQNAESQTGSQGLNSENIEYINGASSDDYARQLETRLRELLSKIDGVGQVQVMITIRSSEELVVEKDEPVSRSNTIENDSEGGTRNVYESESNETTVYRSNGSDSEPYVVKTLTPRVEGVVVVAEGAGTGTISKNITEAVQALFGIEAHKVKVVKMGSK